MAVLPTRAQPVKTTGSSKSPLVMPIAGGAVTVSVTVALCIALVAVPVTVSVYVPGAAVPAATVTVEPPPVVTEVGLGGAHASFGAPREARMIASVGPLVRAVEMADVPVWPWTKERVVGLAVMEKSSGGGAALSLRDALPICIALVAVPVTVSVYVPGAAVPAATVTVEPPPVVTEV